MSNILDVDIYIYPSHAVVVTQTIYYNTNFLIYFITIIFNNLLYDQGLRYSRGDDNQPVFNYEVVSHEIKAFFINRICTDQHNKRTNEFQTRIIC